VRTRHLSLVTSTPSDTTIVRSNVDSPFGPVRAGLTTSQTTNDQALTELLNSLERKVATLVSKSCTVLDTWSTVSPEVSAALCSTQTEEAGTDGNL
jgi:hypothetical protein